MQYSREMAYHGKMRKGCMEKDKSRINRGKQEVECMAFDEMGIKLP